MAFNDAGNIFTKSLPADKIRPALRMADVMGPAPADIMEHGTLFHEMKIDTGIVHCIPAGTVPYCPAVGDDFCAAPGIPQQDLAAFLIYIMHGQATS
jgi:hypothetical protein